MKYIPYSGFFKKIIFYKWVCIEYCIAQNFGGKNFGRNGTARKLVEKTLQVGKGKADSILELKNLTTFWQIKLCRISNKLPNLPKFSPAKFLYYTVFKGKMS